jgi:hypothetical protein
MTRRTIRYAAAAVAAVMAALYFLIGLGVLKVVDAPSADGAPDMLVFGASAGAMFLLGAILLFGLDRRPLWVIGAILQVLVAVMYVTVAPSRQPNFEIWGITLRILQIPLFAALVYLALRPVERPILRVRAR